MRHLPTYPYYLLLCLLYLLLPSSNANIDSWYYAACVKHSENLINSHHLLFNVFGRIFYVTLHTIYKGTDALHALFIMNALAAAVSLLYFFKILILLKQNKEVAMALTLFCGSCFGFFRFATDAETYILPLSFSLISTYYYIRSTSIASILIASIFSALAVLTHQLHLWWSLAICLHLLINKNIQLSKKIGFIVLQFLIPLSYFIAFKFNQNIQTNFITFILGEYSKGNAGIDVSFNSIILTGINSVRTIFQIHGNIGLLLERYPFVFALVFSSMVYIIFHFHKKNRLNLHMVPKKDASTFSSLFLTAFILHLIFAFVSSGNAEFMVMLPFLAVAYFAGKFEFKSLRPALPLTLCLLIWNLSVGIVSNYFFNFNSTLAQEKMMLDNPKALFLWQNKPLIENRICYKFGFHHPYKFLDYDSLEISLENNAVIYTDIGKTNEPINRQSFFKSPVFKFGTGIKLSKIDSFDNFYGKNYIQLISKP